MRQSKVEMADNDIVTKQLERMRWLRSELVKSQAAIRQDLLVRRKKHTTQQVLADQLGVRNTYVCEMESGKRNWTKDMARRANEILPQNEKEHLRREEKA